MSDNELKQRLSKLDVPPPSDAARERAMQAAMQSFAEHQEKNADSRQGSAFKDRPTRTTASWWPHWSRRISMKKAYVYAGSMAAVATVLAITTSHYATIMSPIVPGEPAAIQNVAPATSLPQPLPVEKKAKDDEGLVQAESRAQQPAEPMADMAALPPPPMAAAAPAPQMLGGVAKSAPMKEFSKHSEARMRDMAPPIVMPRQVYQEEGHDKFESFKNNPLKLVGEEPVSTFSLDVDTSSYSFVRRSLNQGTLPQKDTVRIEEMINYFDYNYPVPESKEQPFKPTVTVTPAPWNKDHKLVHIGIKGHELVGAHPRANLVFLLDTSGSMNSPDKLPLVIKSLRMLLDAMKPDDTIAIVTYAGSAGTVLEPTKVSQKAKIIEAMERLSAGGSTAGAEGIRQAYALAKANYDKNAVNRVILATDGDFNVGISDPKELQNYIEKERESGVFLSVLGFGQGNYNDALMQKLAQNGNGNASYIDNLNEARKVLVEESSAMLFTIAKDVKIQVEFNPQAESEYRLIGYEIRILNREDFNNDKVDAGDVGSGKAVTAIYEITPKGSASPSVDPLRYGTEPEAEKSNFGNEYAFLKMRYKLPTEAESKLLTQPIGPAQEVSDIAKASDDVRFGVAVAGFGQLLKGDTHIGTFSYDDAVKLADGARGKDTFGYRVEFTNLVRLAKSAGSVATVTSPPGTEGWGPEVQKR